MATILAYTSPAFGNPYPLVALLVELRRRGHRIVLRTLAGGVAIGNGLGLETALIDPRIEAVEMTDWMAANPRAAVADAFRVFGERAALEADDIRASVDSVRPDVTIIDANCWGAPAVVDAASTPWVSFWPYPPILKSRGVPPFGPGLRPWPGLLGWIRDEALRPFVTKTFEEAMVDPLNRVCRAVGAKSVASADELVRRAPLMLVASAQPFEYPHPDWADHVQMIGPCEFEPLDPDGNEWIDAIELPIVLVTTSSERQSDTALPAAVMAAMCDEPRHVVATFPCGIPDGLTIPDNATARGSSRTVQCWTALSVR